jgi:hypothetical protein
MPFCRRFERGAGSSDEANSVVEPAEHVGMRIGCTRGFCFPGPDREVVGNRNGRASPRAAAVCHLETLERVCEGLKVRMWEVLKDAEA